MATLKRPKLFLNLFFLGILLFVAFITSMFVRTKTQLAREAIQNIREKGGTVVTDGQFHSRGIVSDTLHKIGQTFGFEAELGHRAYAVTTTEKFLNTDIMVINAIPHIHSLTLDSSKMDNIALINLHGSELMYDVKIKGVKCDAEGLKMLEKYPNLKTLTLSSVDYVKDIDLKTISPNVTVKFEQ